MKLLGVLVLCLLLHDVAGQAAMGATLSTNGLNYMAGVLINIIKKNLTVINIPDTSFDKDDFTAKITGTVCNNIDLGTVTVAFQAGLGPVISASGIGVTCNGNWAYRFDKWPHIPYGSGTMTVTIADTSASVGISVHNANLRPSVMALDPQCNVGSVSIHFSGGLSGFILNLLHSYIEGQIRDKMESTVETTLTSVIDTKMNSILSQLQLSAPLNLTAPFNDVSILYGFPYDPTFTSTFVSFPIQGYFVNTTNPSPPPFPNPNVPQVDIATGNRYLQILVTPYTFMSMYYLFYNSGLLTFYVNSSMMPKKAPGLNTSSLNRFAPNLTNYFPPQTPMRIAASANGMASLTFEPPQNATMVVPVAMDFQVQTNTSAGWASAWTMGCHFTTNISMAVSTNASGTQSVTGKVAYLRCQMGLIHSNVGTVYTESIAILLDVMNIKVIVPAVNKMLKNGFPLPSIDNITLTDSELSFGDGYMVIASDFVYNEPSQ